MGRYAITSIPCLIDLPLTLLSLQMSPPTRRPTNNQIPRAPPRRMTRPVCCVLDGMKPQMHRTDPAPDSSTPTKPTSSGGPRPSSSRKIPARKIEVQPTKLEAVDDALDPLGPLGAEPAPIAAPDQAPIPPRKELSARVTRQPSATSGVSGSDYEDASLRPKGPPPVQPQAGATPPRQTQPSMSVEQAAKPTFDILVGDPHKVGDLTSSHIVYQVRTKVCGLIGKAFAAADSDRRLQKHTNYPNSLLHDDTETSSGCILLYTITILGWWSLRLRKNKRLVVSIPNLSSHVVKL